MIFVPSLGKIGKREEVFRHVRTDRQTQSEINRGVSLASQDYSEPFFACTARTLWSLAVHSYEVAIIVEGN